MYKVPVRSNNLLVKTRRTLQIDAKSVDFVHRSRSQSPDAMTQDTKSPVVPLRSVDMANTVSPKPVFNHRKKNHNGQNSPPPKISQTHEEMIQFVETSWQQVMKEYEESRTRGANNVVIYTQETPKTLENFKPFDLEAWWGRRLLEKVDPSLAI